MLRSKSYLQLLVLAAIIGVPVSAIAYGFLKLVSLLQDWIFTSLPKELGFAGTPVWWPLPLLALSGILVAATIQYLPGTAGHIPAEGFKTGGGAPTVVELPGVAIAALATLSLGVVLGPEAPLIAIGGGLGLLSVNLAKRDAPPAAAVVMSSAGSFAAISTLFGSPILGAFLLMEAAGIGGPLLELVLVPGLLAAGVGTLIFVGLNSLTGFGTFSLAIPGLPPFHHLTVALFLWAIVFGLVASVLGTCIRLIGLALLPRVEPRRLLLTPVLGLAIAGLAIAFAEISGRSFSEVLFSGQSALPGLVQHCGRLDDRCPRPPGRLQRAGLRHLALQLPGRTRLPVHVHRGGRRDRRLSPAGNVPGPRGGHGDRRHVHRDAQTPDDGHVAGHAASVQRRHRGRSRWSSWPWSWPTPPRPGCPRPRPTSGR